jgi:hypothetical protein
LKKINSFMRAFLLLAIGCTAMVNAADQKASMTGKWNVTTQLPIGTGNPTFEIVQSGNELSGTYKGALGQSPISGTIEGNAFKITFTAANVECEYVGTLTADEISGTLHLKGLGDGTFKGTRAQ